MTNYKTSFGGSPQDIFEELASKAKYLLAIESEILLLITLVVFQWKPNLLIGLRNSRLQAATNYLIFKLLATDLWCLGRATLQKHKCY